MDERFEGFHFVIVVEDLLPVQRSKERFGNAGFCIPSPEDVCMTIPAMDHGTHGCGRKQGTELGKERWWQAPGIWDLGDNINTKCLISTSLYVHRSSIQFKV